MNFTDLQTFHPTGSRLVVWLDPGLQQTPSGLILPPDTQQIRQHGTVEAVGPSVTLVSVGQRVLLPIHCGTHLFDHKNTPVILVNESDLLAILELSPDESLPNLGS